MMFELTRNLIMGKIKIQLSLKNIVIISQVQENSSNDSNDIVSVDYNFAKHKIIP